MMANLNQHSCTDTDFISFAWAFHFMFCNISVFLYNRIKLHYIHLFSLNVILVKFFRSKIILKQFKAH
jgi:hypothetical protein